MPSTGQEQESINVSGCSKRQVSKQLVAAIEQLQSDPNHNVLSKYLLHQIVRGFHDHRPGTDATCYNGGTILALAATGFATVAPASGSWPLAARIATGLATLLIAMLRSLDFGSRWRWQVRMRSAYMQLLDQLALAMAADDRNTQLEQVTLALVELRGRESSIPGVGEAVLGDAERSRDDWTATGVSRRGTPS